MIKFQIIFKKSMVFIGSNKLFVLFILTVCQSCNSQPFKSKEPNNTTTHNDTTMNFNPLTPEEQRVILNKGTESPFKGEYTDNFKKGTYYCKQCNAALYTSDSKFHSGCGWPSFDDEIDGAVKKTVDADGSRTEITCARCNGHLGHVFYGEGFTDKDTRHCVNSISMIFKENSDSVQTAKAIFAGGCFWGVEYYFQKAKGVIKTQVGYTGGTKENPTYREVCNHVTGHYEALEVTYDPSKTTYEELARLFFEIHDPTQADGQGNDVGPQYLSAVFYLDDSQKATAEKLIDLLNKKGYKVATHLKKATIFWPAESYHQQYYEKGGGTPYCHSRVSRF
jgi:peptide methionine sulfoxide reductase msrA/msrB